ncbi:M56 family metallopeptidase [Paenibacillus sp. Leaf72]|uniref:M56 family metallopeptidase n=1 Tax=Paenibacillus sp. Leaf72 TaxID=1736234 RepID=UPI0007C7827E|nr:M56 family metallopeptidase [Paenibacillus sp. Leaf72]
MSELFLSVLNMSLTASYVILVVILIRLLLKKAPKVISYALWGVVAFRLVVPVTFESVYSLLPRNGDRNPIPQASMPQQSPQINSGIEVVDSIAGGTIPAMAAQDSVNPWQIYIQIGSYIWILCMLVLLIYSLASVFLLKKQLKDAQRVERNIYEAGNLKTPFVLGFIRPKIYLPVGLDATERSYILLHEQTHIKRLDHIIKPAAFLLLSVHWFNPLVWVAFMLMSRDMEFSCDERVLKKMDFDVAIKKSYASSLLSLAADRPILNGNPLAFGEGNVKGRIKNVLNYRKPKFWLLAFSIIILLAVGIGLIANPVIKGRDALEQITDLENISSGEEVSLERPEKSAAEILKELANQPFSISGNQIGDDDQETVVTFGKAFVNLYTGAVAEQETVTFRNYISNENLLKYTNTMLELEQRKELKGAISVHFGLENEFKEAELKKLDVNLYYVSLPFSNQGSGMNLQMLVQAENKALKIVDYYFGNKDGVDTIATGHPADRKLHDPKRWDDQVWVDGVFEKLDKIEI